MLQRLLVLVALSAPSVCLAAAASSTPEVAASALAAAPEAPPEPAGMPLASPPTEPPPAPEEGARPLAAAADDVPPPPAPLAELPSPPPPPSVQPASVPPTEAPATKAEPAAGRPPRVAIGASLGANTISGVGLQLLWRTGSHFGWAFGVGGGVSGLRYGVQGRFFFRSVVSSPFIAVDFHGNTGIIVDSDNPAPRHDSDGNETGGTFTYSTAHSELLGTAFGWHLVWGHFFLEPTVGWSVLVSGGGYLSSPQPAELSKKDRQTAAGDRGGPQLGLTTGFTW